MLQTTLVKLSNDREYNIHKNRPQYQLNIKLNIDTICFSKHSNKINQCYN